jgi:hypothetical protein
LLAAKEGKLEAVDLLLSKGANIEAKDNVCNISNNISTYINSICPFFSKPPNAVNHKE